MGIGQVYGSRSLALFGAVGDGTTDDYAAIQAAVVSGAVLHGEPGRTYKISAPIVLPSAGPFHLNLNGATIKASAVMSAVLLKSAHTYTSVLWKIHNGIIDGNLQAAAGIRIDNGNFLDLEDLQIQNVTSCGIDLGGTSGLQVYEGTMRRVRVIGMVSGTAANRPATGIWFGANATDHLVSDVIVKNCKTYGVRIQGATNILRSVHVYGFPEPDYATDYHFHVTGSGTSLSQCYADGPYVTGYYLDATGFVCDNNVVLWNASNPPTDAVGFHVTANPASGAWSCSHNMVRASTAVTLAATNQGFVFDQSDGHAIGNTSNISERGGTRNLTNRTNQPTILFSTLDLKSAKFNLNTITANGSVAASEEVYYVTTGGSSVTVSLLTAADGVNTAGPGKRYRIVKADSGAGTVIVLPQGSETINGAASKTLTGRYSAIYVESDGQNWHVISQMGTVT